MARNEAEARIISTLTRALTRTMWTQIWTQLPSRTSPSPLLQGMPHRLSRPKRSERARDDRALGVLLTRDIRNKFRAPHQQLN
jgi:hypothetical protein